MAKSRDVEYRRTHRLIPTKYSGEGRTKDSNADGELSVLALLPLSASTLADLSELDAATNERLLAEKGQSLTIGPAELVAGIPEASIINAAFCHAGMGSRFNDANRGAWYAGIEVETSLHEVAFHKRRFLRDTRYTRTADFDYRDFLADFAGLFAHLTEAEQRTCLLPEPVPACYAPGQALARTLLYAGGNGIVYPSVRNAGTRNSNGGTCIVCFRPAMVSHCRRGQQYRLTISATEERELRYAVVS